MKKQSDKYFLLPILVIMMAFMISDYKVLCNMVGSACTVLLLIYISGKYYSGVVEKKYSTYFILFLVYYTLSSLFEFNPSWWIRYLIYYLMLFSPFLLCNYILGGNDRTLIKYILGAFFIIWTVFCVLCTQSCMAIPDLARLMAAYRSEYYQMINGGGYPMGYAAVILSTFLFNQLLSGNIKSKFWRIFFYAQLGMMAIMVLTINSFIILVGLIIGYGINIIGRVAKTGSSRIFSYVTIGMFSLVIYLNIGSILLFLVNNTQDEFWHHRWVETYDSVVLGQDSHHIDHRQEMYDISLEGFKENPVFGVGYRYGNSFDHDSTFKVGNHSTILDTLAQYGIVGAIPLFLFLLYPVVNNRRKGFNSNYLIPFYIMAYLNPIFTCYHAMVVIYLIIPLMQHYLINDEEYAYV